MKAHYEGEIAKKNWTKVAVLTLWLQAEDYPLLLGRVLPAVCVCVRVCVHACVRACVHACMCVFVNVGLVQVFAVS